MVSGDGGSGVSVEVRHRGHLDRQYIPYGYVDDS